MTNKYTTLSYETRYEILIEHAEKVYRKAHPELDGVPLSKNKILREVFIFYLKKTEWDVDITGVLKDGFS